MAAGRIRAGFTVLGDERGSFLVEVVVTSVILLITAAGVLSMIDNAGARSAEQRARAAAGNIAQNELERLRTLPLDEISNHRSADTKTVNGKSFQIESRADWITDAAGEASCATGGAAADYLRITTTVDSESLQGGAPARLDSIIAPPARAFGPTQGSLAVQVVDASGAPVSDLSMNLDGPATVSGVTNDKGCVLWGYLPASNAYELTFARAGWIGPSGATNIVLPQTVTGLQTTTAPVVKYDRGGMLRSRFETVPASGGAARTTEPRFASLQNVGPPSTFLSYPVTAGQLQTPPLFPFSSDWSVYADGCTAARPPTPIVGDVLPAQTVDTPVVVLPSLDLKVVVTGGAVVPGARIIVTSACGTRYERVVAGNGRLADPGFPWGAATICVDGTISGVKRRQTLSLTNATLPGQDKTITFTTSSTAGACP